MSRVTPKNNTHTASVIVSLMGVLCVASAFALSNSTGPNGCNAQAVHALGYTGQGVKIGLVSQAHTLYTHEAFAGAASWYDATDQNIYEPRWHDTSLAGMACSRGGALYPNDKGVAPSSELISVRVTRPDPTLEEPNRRAFDFGWVEDALSYLKNQNARVVVTGIQLGGTADGTSEFSRLYDYYAYQYDMVFAVAAGNTMSGPATQVTVFGDIYNGITTAGLILESSDWYNQVGVWSNLGTTADDRRKPEVSGPSQSQWVPTVPNNNSWKLEGVYPRGETSWAVPHTAGVAAVLLSYADTTTEPDDGKSEVIKAVMVNSTFPNIDSRTGSWTDPANATWHPERGYGRLDALRAYQTLAAGKVIPGTLTQPKGWAYQSFKEKNNVDERYYIPGLKNQRLLATLTWHRKVSSIYQAENSLNIGLSIYNPQGQQIINLSGGKDNLRKADILLEEDRVYEIRISKSNIFLGSPTLRYYALAFELLDPLEGDWNTDYKVDLGDLTLLWDCWLDGCSLDAFELLSTHWLAIDARYAAG